MHPAGCGGGGGGDGHSPHPCPLPRAGEGDGSGSGRVTEPLVKVENLVREYTMPREKLLQPPAKVHALNGVSFTIEAGRSLGIVGESGSGKSTLARLVMALDKPTSGRVSILGRDLNTLP